MKTMIPVSTKQLFRKIESPHNVLQISDITDITRHVQSPKRYKMVYKRVVVVDKMRVATLKMQLLGQVHYFCSVLAPRHCKLCPARNLRGRLYPFTVAMSFWCLVRIDIRIFSFRLNNFSSLLCCSYLWTFVTGQLQMKIVSYDIACR